MPNPNLADKHDFTLDMYGRIYTDGEHVGWVRKDSDPHAIEMLREKPGSATSSAPK